MQRCRGTRQQHGGIDRGINADACDSKPSCQGGIPKGTGRLTDNGRCGSLQSVGGFLPSVEIEKFLTGVPARSRETVAGTEIQGVLFEVEGNRCLSAEILRRPVTVADIAKEEEEC